MNDDPELIAYQEYLKNFGEQEWTILKLETENVYAPEFLKDLRKIIRKIEALDNVIKVNSIVNIRDNEILPDESLSYTQVYPDIGENQLLTQEEARQFRENLEKNPIFHKSILDKKKSDQTVILIQNVNQIHNTQPYRITLIDSIKKIVRDYPAVNNYALVGTTVINAELNKSSLRDVYIFYTLISIMLIFFGATTLRQTRDVIILITVVVGSILPTMGLIAACDIPFNMVTVMLPTILVALSVADAVHVIHDFHLERQTQEVGTAVKKCIQKLWKPSLYTSATTVVGFLSLTGSTVSPVFQLGIFASLGITIAWITTMTLVPHLLIFFWSQHRIIAVKYNNSHFGDRMLTFIQRGRLPFLVLFFLLFIPAMGITQLDVDTNYTKFFSEKTETSIAYDSIDKAGFAQNPLSLVLTFPEGKYFGNHQYHQGIIKFETEIKKLPEVIKLLSLNALLMEVDRALNGLNNDPHQTRFSEYNEEQMAQLLFLAELGGNDDINDFIVEDKNKIQLIALTPYMSSKELNLFREKITLLKNKYLPEDMTLKITGSTVLWANMDKQVSRTQLLSILAIGLFLIVFLPVIFGSLRLGIIGLIMNILPLCVSLGVMSFLNIKINIATALIGGIALGVVVDDTLHMIFRARLCFNQGLTWHNAVDQAVASVGNSIVTTSVILIGGFLCMATSDFLPSAHFGFFVALSILIALFLDLIILPITLKWPFMLPTFARVRA
ncbi:MAG: MMPL family transporter [Desulfobulbaceae bacterium]|nr:MMPL family transporter [Desulfobulbaceae bacterium]